MCYHYSEGDSGIFTSSFHSEQDSDPSFRLSVSQSFGKSFPDISEDGEDVPDGRELPGDHEGLSDHMRLSTSFTGPSTDQSQASPGQAPAKPRRTMVTSYSNINIAMAAPEKETKGVSASVRSRVKMFESMSTDGKSVRSIREAKRGASEERMAKVEAPTPTPAPVMSISSSSSATSCGYKDFLIDDDYIDQQQLIISSNREVREVKVKDTGSSLENTLKEKVNKFLANDKENDEKSDDDDCSVRELFVSSAHGPGSSVDTLSEQASISSEAGDIERPDIEELEGESELGGVFEIQQFDHNVLQDVMDVNTLLLKLQTILMEVCFTLTLL